MFGWSSNFGGLVHHDVDAVVGDGRTFGRGQAWRRAVESGLDLSQGVDDGRAEVGHIHLKPEQHDLNSGCNFI